MNTLPGPDPAVLERAQALVAAGDPLAIEIYAMGRRAGISAERARTQLEAAAFIQYLGPIPALPDYHEDSAQNPTRSAAEPLHAAHNQEAA